MSSQKSEDYDIGELESLSDIPPVEAAASSDSENRDILDCMLRILGIYKEKKEQ